MPKPTVLPDSHITPPPELEKRTRRVFDTDYKLRIIREADQCPRGGIGALLRREKLYSNQLQQWRRELAAGGAEALSKSQPGPKAKLTAEQRRIEQLERENARLQRKLQIAEDCVMLQKKAMAMIDHLSDEPDA